MYLETGAVEDTNTFPIEIGVDDINEILEQWNNTMDQNRTSDDISQIMERLKNLTMMEPRFEEIVTIRKWDFYDAFFFSLTVVTTIGYGHLSPITEGAQVFCIFYSIVGVPLTGILIAAFGDVFSSVLLKAHERSKNERFNSTFALVVNTIFYLIPGTIVFLFLPSVVFAYLEDWSYLQSFYYAFITLTTIGFGDYVAGGIQFENRWIYQVGIMVWIVFGLGYWAMMLNFIIKAMKSKQVKRFNKTMRKGFRQTQRMISKEMEEFMNSMNQYSTKLMAKPQTKLKRTKSLPLLSKHVVSENGRCASDSALIVHHSAKDDDMYTIQQEAHTNTMGFIFQLAKAFAFGDLGGPADSISMRSLRSSSRHPSLLDLLADTVAQAQSRRGSTRDGTLFPTHPAFSRLQSNRRSSEIPDLRTLGVVENSGFGPRRCSDFGYYVDPSRQPPSIPVLEEVNELDLPLTSSSKDTLMSNASSTPKTRRHSKLKRSTSQEIDNLMLELKRLENLWAGEQQASTNGKILSGEVKQPQYVPPTIPTVEITAPTNP